MFKLGYCGLVDTINSETNTEYITSNNVSNLFTGIISVENIVYDTIQLGSGYYDILYIDNDNQISFDGDNNLPVEWGNTTVLFAKFNGNLSAGNLDFSVDELDYILICKREIDSKELIYTPVDIIYSSDFVKNKGAILYDRFVQCNKEYDYKAIPVLLDGTESTSLFAKYKTDKKIRWYGHYIYDGTTEYHCNINTDLSWTRNKPASVVNTATGKYPYRVCWSQNNYDTITIKGTHFKLDNCNFDLDATAEYNKTYDDFITNGNPKLIRDWTGRMWIAELDGNIEHSAEGHHNNISTQHTFVEIADANDQTALYQYGFTDYNPSVMQGNGVEDVKYGATIEITLTDKNGNVLSNKNISLLLNSIEIWKCTTDTFGKAVVTNLDAGFYTIVVGSGVYATKKNISINSSSPTRIPINIKVGV